MKLIRNRTMLQAKRRRYSHLMQSFRATIKEGAQEMSKKDAMIDWLAQACADLALELCDYPKFQRPFIKEKQDWINDAAKAVHDADRK